MLVYVRKLSMWIIYILGLSPREREFRRLELTKEEQNEAERIVAFHKARVEAMLGRKLEDGAEH